MERNTVSQMTDTPGASAERREDHMNATLPPPGPTPTIDKRKQLTFSRLERRIQNHTIHESTADAKSKKHESNKRRVSVDVDKREGLRMESIGEMHMHEDGATQADAGTIRDRCRRTGTKPTPTHTIDKT